MYYLTVKGKDTIDSLRHPDPRLEREEVTPLFMYFTDVERLVLSGLEEAPDGVTKEAINLRVSEYNRDYTKISASLRHLEAMGLIESRGS